ncbi:MAG: ABC transporter ATP-binding protein [Legionella sp.]|nr:ABC transporter ATP-binding protein [Legionella sp.]
MLVFFKRFFFFLNVKGARKQFVGLLLLSLFSSLLDVVGIGLIGVFLSVIANPAILVSYLSDLPFYELFHFSEGSNQPIFYLGALIIFIFAFKAIFSCFIQGKMTSFSYGHALTLKARLLQAFQYAPYTYHIKRNSAYLIDYIQKIDGYAAGVLMSFLTIISSLVMVVSIVIFLFWTHPITTLILMGLFALIFLVNNVLMKGKVSELGRVVAVTRGLINKNFLHALKGLKEIRILGQEAFFLKSTQTANNVYTKALKTHMLYQLLPRSVIEALLAIFIMLLCMGSIAMGMSAAEVIAFTGVFVVSGARLIPMITLLTSGINGLVFSNKILIQLHQEFTLLNVLNQTTIPANKVGKLPFQTASLQNIIYSYPEAKQAALNNVTFSFEKGQSVGIIGSSGAGKSTLVDLLLGFLQAEAGQILIDGQPLTDAKAWLSNFAYIPQQIFLLDDTLKQNIVLGVKPEDIDDSRMEAALEMAQLKQVVADLPEGLETILGENGVRLSGGQRQRVALARAFYHNKDIIVMDEATSALDNETEHEIINAIKMLHGVKTLIIIAHRLTTIEHCDVLFKMEKGQIIQTGTFQEMTNINRAQQKPLIKKVPAEN